MIGRLAYPRAQHHDRTPRADVELLKKFLFYFYGTRSTPPQTDAHVPLLFAAHAGILINAIFPSAWGMSDLIINEGHAAAPAKCAARMRQQEERGELAVGAPLAELVSEAEAELAKSFWNPFERAPHASPWKALAPLLELLLEQDGSLDLDLAAIDAVSAAFEKLVKEGSYLIGSPDGFSPPREPHPLAGIRTAQAVRSEHVVPRITPRISSSGEVTPARATLVGLPALGFQQLLNLLLASSRDERVNCNYSLNFSYLVLRPSAAPDILKAAATARSAKAISCLNVEGDELQFGSREEKLLVTRLHRIAWAYNLNAIKSLCLDVAPPLPESQRTRGDLEANKFVRARKMALESENRVTVQQERARAAFAAVYDELGRS